MCSCYAFLFLSLSHFQVESIDPFIYDVLYRAETDLRSFKYQSLIRKLKDSPNGVSDLDMQNEVEDGVQLCNALDVAPALRASQAVYYNVEHGLYMLQSQAHRTALERMMLPDPPVWSSSHSN